MEPAAANVILVRVGSQEIKMPSGVTVSKIREQLQKLGLNDPNTTAYVGAQALSEDSTPSGGSTVSFTRKMGEKGGEQG